MIADNSQHVTKRFMDKVLVAKSGCWEWTSTLHRNGYGKFWFVGRQVQAHRVAYELLKGDTKNKWVLHTCDNRKCVNPDHLYLGDAKQNARDRTDRKRYKITVPLPDVEQIRTLYKSGNYTQQDLSDKFGIHQTQISRYILRRQRQDY